MTFWALALLGLAEAATPLTLAPDEELPMPALLAVGLLEDDEEAVPLEVESCAGSERGQQCEGDEGLFHDDEVLLF